MRLFMLAIFMFPYLVCLFCSCDYITKHGQRLTNNMRKEKKKHTHPNNSKCNACAEAVRNQSSMNEAISVRRLDPFASLSEISSTF